MNAHARRAPRAQLPTHLAQMVRRMDSSGFQIVGLPIDVDDPVFKDRGQAEEWLAARLDMKCLRAIRPRPCMCCATTFTSTGPGHRLCDTCRQMS